MGLMDWIFGRVNGRETPADVIWLNHRARLAGIAARASDSLQQGYGKTAVLVVAHFPDTLNELDAINVSEDDNNRNGTATALAANLEKTKVAATLSEAYRLEI